MRYCIGFESDDKIDVHIAKQYYEVFKTLPERWRQNIQDDGWIFSIIDKEKLGDNEFFVNIDVNCSKRVIYLANVPNKEDQQLAIYNAFTEYILCQFEWFYCTDRYNDLEKRYYLDIYRMNKLTNNRYGITFSLLLLFYLNSKYGKKYFEENNLLELYSYIDEWMNFKVFDISYESKWLNNIVIGPRVTQEAVKMMEKAILKLPPLLLDELQREFYIFIMANDRSDTIERIADRDWNGLCSVELRRFYIRPYCDITSKVFHEVGHYFYYRYLTRFLSSEDIYKQEKKNAKLVDEYILDVENDISEFYSEAFVYYFFKPQEVQKYLPQTYAKLTEKLEKFKIR